MNFMRLGVRAKLLLVIGAVMMVMAGTAAIGFWGSWNAIRQFDETVIARETEALAIASLATEFKLQIQEWKDVLLRGSDPGSFEKHWTSFEKQEKLVEEQGLSLSLKVPDPESAQLLRDFVAAHQQMGEAYRRGLDQFKKANFDSKAGDKAVAGIDREPSKLLTQARDRILAEAKNRAALATMRGLSNLRYSAVLMAGISVAGLVLFVTSVQGFVIRPISNLTDTTNILSSGQTEIVISGVERQDEIGPLARALEQWRVSLIEQVTLRNAQEQQRRQAAMAERTALLATADSLESQVGAIVASVSAATVKLDQSSEELAINIVKSSVLAAGVAVAAEQATSNVATVASATEELSATSAAISDQMATSVTVATRAESDARLASDLISELSESVTSIGVIVDLISDIASQTNLLALNATIEAARAGDAGKGFAVVAGEVKTLASQTARATSDISGKIDAVRSGTHKAVEAVQAISVVIGEINAIGQNVSLAVDQQTTATREIARNIDQAATGTRSVSRSIAELEAVARTNSDAAALIKTLTADLTGQGGQLDVEVKRFLGGLRA